MISELEAVGKEGEKRKNNQRKAESQINTPESYAAAECCSSSRNERNPPMRRNPSSFIKHAGHHLEKKGVVRP